MGSSRYVYAVVPDDVAGTLPERPGIDKAPVGALRVGRVAALVSDAPDRKVRPTRANLGLHEQVVCAAHAAGPVLPLRFGTVLADARAVRDDLLARNAARFAEALDELSGKDEFRLRARYLPDVALRDVIERSPAVRRLRSRMASRRTVVGDRIQLGELVFAELQRLKEADASEILQVVAPHVIAWTALNDAADDVAVYVACLVQRDCAEKWDSALRTLAERCRLRLRFEVIGPLPAWDFTDARVEVA